MTDPQGIAKLYWGRWLAALAVALTVGLTPLIAEAGASPEGRVIADVRVPLTEDSAAGPLKLNGAGLRRKFLIKIYVAALYSAKPVASFDEAASLGTARRLKLHFLRNISGKEISDVLVRAITATSTPSEVGKASVGIAKLGEMVNAQKSLKPGDTLSVDWIPGRGTCLSINDHEDSPCIVEPEFNRALLRIFLGEQPIDAGLKEELLGHAN